jgi:tetratricopeptide (TPR) repeat protein
MLDRDGNRIDRRYPQDIFVPLYNKQIPPGAGQVVHFGLDVPKDVTGPIALEARVNYRKFDRKYMDYVFGKGKGPELPVVVMASDAVNLFIAGGPKASNEPSPIKEVWQRWNDYGIGLLLEGSEKGSQKGELKQAEPVFKKVAELGKADGWVNLARVYIREGRIPDAVEALEKAASQKEPAAPWVINWLTGQINDRNGHLDEAIASYESVLATKIPDRGFDFSLDYEVINALGTTLYNRARVEAVGSPERSEIMGRALTAFRRTLAIDSENVAAHYGLGLIYNDLARGNDWTPFDPEESDPNVIPLENWSRAIDRAADPKAKPEARLQRMAMLLYNGVEKIVTGERPEFGSRLEPLYELVEKLGPLSEREQDPKVRQGLARLLEWTHKSLHQMLKPDELAEGRAVATARKNDPAADQNAQSVVIHPLHRPGAPGLSTQTVPETKAASVGRAQEPKEAGE